MTIQKNQIYLVNHGRPIGKIAYWVIDRPPKRVVYTSRKNNRGRWNVNWQNVSLREFKYIIGHTEPLK